MCRKLIWKNFSYLIEKKSVGFGNIKQGILGKIEVTERSGHVIRRESFETVLKNRDLKLDKKDLDDGGIAFLVHSEGEEFPF